MSISAIVPVWNGRPLLEKLIASLERQTLAAAELLVVDNGSTDGAPDLARERGARVIPMGRNAGFAAAVNRGIEESRGEWVAVLNSDVELAPDYFDVLHTAAESPEAWFATGKILAAGTTDSIDATFDLVCRGATPWRAGSGRTDGPSFAAPRPIWSAPWTAALFRAELFRRVGRLETSFESYLEDVDFGMRCAARKLSGLYVPTAIAWHRGSAALGRWHPETVRHIARNQVLLLARHYPALAPHLWPAVVAQTLWGALALRHGAGIACLRGKWEGLRRFHAARQTSTPIDQNVLGFFLESNERSIREIQAATGFDTYWKMYFLLTRGGTK
jgi:GT2 family glycosyltransferase